MKKTNFSKVEKSLEEGMIRMKSERLLKEAEDAKKSKLPKSEESQPKLKKKLQKPSETDEELVEHGRTKHLTKRFNVNDKWIPLDRNRI